MNRFLATPERVAVAGDWHANAAWAQRALYSAADLGATHVVHLGDFGYRFTPDYLQAIEMTLSVTDMTLGFVDGNHEDFSWLNRRHLNRDGTRQLTNRISHLPRGFRWTWDTVSMVALGGAHSVDRPSRIPYVSWWPEEHITYAQALQVVNGGRADVMFMHDCPAGVDIPRLTQGGFFESEIQRSEDHRTMLRAVVDAVQPAALWHGHYHRRYTACLRGEGFETKVIGLDCDGTSMHENLMVVPVDQLAAPPTVDPARLYDWD